MKDDRGDELSGALLPVVEIFLCPLALGVDGDLYEISDVPHLGVTEPNLLEGVDAGGMVQIRGVEEIDLVAQLLLAPACGQVEVLSLHIVNHGRSRPGEKRRDHHADALARTIGSQHKSVSVGEVDENGGGAGIPDRPD